jgi:outer membrane receptor protein involved in Fe transport
MAAGLDWRSERFTGLQISGATVFALDFDRIVRSAFGEAYLPLVGESNAFPGFNRMEISIAARWDDYSSFGSSVDPKVGFMWEPFGGLRLRGSYGTSYAAPKLSAYSTAADSAVGITAADPAVGGPSRQLRVGGTDVGSLTAQESESITFGLELAPVVVPGLLMAANYYRIDYTDRVSSLPSADVILNNPASFSGQIIRNPTVEEVNRYVAIGQAANRFFDFDKANTSDTSDFDPSDIAVIIDTRRRNLAALESSGVDLSLAYGFSAWDTQVHLGLAGTYIFELVQQTNPAAAPLDQVDTFYNPPDWRARASASLRRRAWSANLFLNHTDSYVDNRRPAPVPVASYTTVDARAAYDFSKRFSSGVLSGVTLAASAQNLFDRAPPRTSVFELFRDLGFDPTNANPMGRFAAIELRVAW